MNILVLGGTRFFGIPMVEALINKGHSVTIGTRGSTPDPFGDSVSRITLDRTDPDSLVNALSETYFDVVIDKICYCSNDMKYLMDVVNCGRYIYMSTTAVYEPKHIDTKEEDFDPMGKKLIWCSRPDYPYDVVKRSAECALWQKYGNIDFVSVRYPFVVGKDDYTQRLRFYVEHTMKGIPMYIDDLDEKMGFIDSKEAGEFIAFLVDHDLKGAVNGCSHGAVSVGDILRYVEDKTGAKAILSTEGDKAPYNGEADYTINTDKAEAAGFRFSCVDDWIWKLLDHYIELIREA